MPHFSAKSYQTDLSLLDEYSAYDSHRRDGLLSNIEEKLKNSEQSQNHIVAQKLAWLLSRLSAQQGMGSRALHYAQVCAEHCRAANLCSSDKIYCYDAFYHAHYLLGNDNDGFAYQQLTTDVVEMLAEDVA